MSVDRLEKAVAKVVRSGCCTGCGGCTLVSPRISMELDEFGFQRPRVDSRTSGNTREEVRAFSAMCPGKRVVAPPLSAGAEEHDVFGRFVCAFEASATSTEIRRAGSSGGVLTALQVYLLESGLVTTVSAANSDDANPTRTVPLRLTTKSEALAGAGSRYAPVSNLCAVGPDTSSAAAVVGKPCEASALVQYLDDRQVEQSDRPYVLSFFCAGTPSQLATDNLIVTLGRQPAHVTALRYRGDGWPGRFRLSTVDDSDATMSYNESWGSHLGRDVQWRCKLCVDGTGGHADVAVGDYWEIDNQGYPLFTEADGRSVAIARTERGARLLSDAAAAGYIDLRAIDLDDVARVQPLQTDRRRTLLARLIGRVLSGHAVPNYRGYHLLARQREALRAAPRAAMRTLVRSHQSRSVRT